MKTNTVLQAATALGEFQRLANLVNPENGNDRWKALQDWLDENPKYRKIFETYLHLTPNEAVDELILYLTDEYNLSPIMITALDRKGEMRAMAATAIERIQTLYKERRNAD